MGLADGLGGGAVRYPYWTSNRGLRRQGGGEDAGTSEPADCLADAVLWTGKAEPGKMGQQAQAHGEGTTIVTKAGALPDNGYFHKSEFEIDLEAGADTLATTAFHRTPKGP